MRVLKFAQIVGAAAGLLLLGGTAMADSSNAGPSAGPAQHQKGDYAKAQSAGSQSNPGPNVSSSNGSNSSADNLTTNSASQSSGSSNNSSPTLNSNGTNGDSNGSGSNNSNVVGSSPGNGNNHESNTNDGANSSGPQNSLSGVGGHNGVSTSTDSAPVQIQNVDSSVDSAPATTGSPSSSPTTIPVIQATFHPSADAEVVTTYHLALQPPIISYRYAAIPDFATNLPMHTPAPRGPVPPKSNGVLGELSLALDSVLVPQSYGPQPVALGWVVFTLMLLTLVLMPISLFRYNYGWWLRRGGLVTAPRSDAPTSRFVTPSLIATPLCMGYVKAELRTHSPSLMV
jgi:hypothetical protein